MDKDMMRTKKNSFNRSPGMKRNFQITAPVLFFLLLAFSLPARAEAPAAATESTPAAQEQSLPEQETEEPATTGAEQTEPSSFRYAPDHCDFEITFPEEPYTSRRCPEGPEGRCYKLSSYTMVFDMATTVDVSVTCNPLQPGEYERYDENVMRAALRGMVERNGVDHHTISFNDTGSIRQATLTGSGRIGRKEKIYTSQLWVGPASILTLEAELVGSTHHEADQIFSNILQSLHEKTAPEEEELPEDKSK